MTDLLSEMQHLLPFFTHSLSLQPQSTCFSSIPLQLLFLTLHLSTSVYFFPFFSLFTLSFLSLSIVTFVHSSFLTSSFLNFCISCTGISFRKCIFQLLLLLL